MLLGRRTPAGASDAPPGFALFQLQVAEALVGHHGFDQLGRIVALQVQLRQRADRVRAAQLDHDAFGARRVAVDFQVVRTHIGDALAVLRPHGPAREAGVAAGQDAVLHAAMEQVDVAQEAVHERRRRMVVHLGRRADLFDLPLFISTTRSATSSASSWSCVTKIEVTCRSSCRRRSQRRNSLRTLASSAPNGSSSSRTRGSTASARASAIRCRWPPDSCGG
jgi:hypothetical protein